MSEFAWSAPKDKIWIHSIFWMSQMCSQCALGDCPDKMCVTHTIKICVDCKMAPYTNQITFANKLPGLKNEIVFI